MVDKEAGLDGFGRAVQWMVAFFYSNNDLLTSPMLDRLQVALCVFTGLFDRVGLQTNVKKTVGMVCQLCYIVDGHSEVTYTRNMTGMGPFLGEWQQERVRCSECEVKLAVGLLEDHLQAQHGK